MTATATDLRLTVYTRGGWHRYEAVFTGPNADAIAADFVKARRSKSSFDVHDDFDEVAFPQVADAMFPTCEHGLSERLCAGPMHYPDM